MNSRELCESPTFHNIITFIFFIIFSCNILAFNLIWSFFFYSCKYFLSFSLRISWSNLMPSLSKSVWNSKPYIIIIVFHSPEQLFGFIWIICLHNSKTFLFHITVNVIYKTFSYFQKLYYTFKYLWRWQNDMRFFIYLVCLLICIRYISFFNFIYAEVFLHLLNWFIIF